MRCAAIKQDVASCDIVVLQRHIFILLEHVVLPVTSGMVHFRTLACDGLLERGAAVSLQRADGAPVYHGLDVEECVGHYGGFAEVVIGVQKAPFGTHENSDGGCGCCGAFVGERIAQEVVVVIWWEVDGCGRCC